MLSGLWSTTIILNIQKEKKSSQISETETEYIRVELELQRPQSYKMQPRRHIFSSLGIFFMLEHVTNVFNRKYHSVKLFSSCNGEAFRAYNRSDRQTENIENGMRAMQTQFGLYQIEHFFV